MKKLQNIVSNQWRGENMKKNIKIYQHCGKITEKCENKKDLSNLNMGKLL